MTALRLNLAADINRAHELADAKAGEAIGHAIEAGKLLLEAKAALPHGEWLPWLESNIWVTPRRCQQYMRAAQGKPVVTKALFGPDEPAKPNTKSISHLEVAAPRLIPGDADPDFVPEVHLCYGHARVDGTLYLVEPSSRHPGFFFVSRLDKDDEHYDCTRRPIGAQWVEGSLQYYGLASPAAVAWKVKESAGVLTAMETFDGVMA